MKITRTSGAAVVASTLLLVSIAGFVSETSNAEAYSEKEVAVADAKGSLQVPGDYRTQYQFLGTWSVANDQGPGAKQLHEVYASPGAVEAYRKDGHFPDGSILVKEVYKAATESMTTGTVSHPDKLAGWFVMVKDSKNSYPENKLWGDGWGWAWFDADRPQKTTTVDYKNDCISCHIPAKSSDWVYVNGYPSLRR
jgi:hypothetical protein